MVEPWLRGTLTGIDAVPRQVLHALELAQEDAEHWCAGLSDHEVDARPFGVAPVAFHLRHISRSLDRLLTYAESRQLTPAQLQSLRGELEPGARTADVLAELGHALEDAKRRITVLASGNLDEPREVGRGRLPSTLGGLLVHCAEHTQRHIGQAITTSQVVRGLRSVDR